MDPVTLGALVAVLVVLAGAFVVGAVTLWALRRAMALLKRLVVLSFAFLVLAGIVGTAVAVIALSP
jgi:hypothetical protein